MSETTESGSTSSVDVKPHAYDPVTQPELFEGVLARRVVAFLIDVIVIAVPLVAARGLHPGLRAWSRSASAGSCSCSTARSR